MAVGELNLWKEVDAAKREVEQWPSWLKKAKEFEDKQVELTDRTSENVKTVGTPVDE